MNTKKETTAKTEREESEEIKMTTKERTLAEEEKERERNQPEPVIWELSEREKEIIRSLEEDEQNGNPVPENCEYKNK